MSSSRAPHPQAAAAGAAVCLWRFFLPPLSVILLGVGFAYFLSTTTLQMPAANHSQEKPAAAKQPAEQDTVQLAPFFSPQVLYWEEKIIKWSTQKGLDPNLVATVMQIESCGDPRARSSAGAMGLFQVMPYHFQKGENPYHPKTNARRGLSYLKSARAKGGNPRLAFAGYNGGIQGAQRPVSAWPAETKRYVYWGTGIYEDARAGKDRSPRLEEWLSSGGKWLCNQAQARLNNGG